MIFEGTFLKGSTEKPVEWAKKCYNITENAYGQKVQIASLND